MDEKEKVIRILGKYKVVGDTTYGLGYEDAEKLAEEIIEELCFCHKDMENGKAFCGVRLDCHLHDWRNRN